MARPRSISDDQIIQAARAEFLEHGVAATTASIARRAGVSEGTIFRRYESKDELLLAAMVTDGAPPWAELVLTLARAPEPRADLERIGLDVIAFFEEVLPRMHLLMSCHVQPLEIVRHMRQPPPLLAVRALSTYFDAAIAAGTLRSVDPEVAARVFLGSMHQYAFFEHAGINETLPMTRTTYVRGVTDLVLRGALSSEEIQK